MEIIGIIVVALVLWFFGYCASFAPGPIASILEFLLKGGSIVVILCYVLSKICHLAMSRQKPKKRWVNNGPTPLPALRNDPHNGIYIAENEERLVAWNAENFDINPAFIYPGPEGEDDEARWLRYSLFTPKQQRLVPLLLRTGIRRRKYYHHSGEATCMICGKTPAAQYKWNLYWDAVHVCETCHKRYEDDKKKGWTAPADFNKTASIMLWTIQQRIAINLRDRTIPKETALTEMNEAEEVTRRAMIEADSQDMQRRAQLERERAKQEQLSDIVRDLTHR